MSNYYTPTFGRDGDCWYFMDGDCLGDPRTTAGFGKTVDEAVLDFEKRGKLIRPSIVEKAKDYVSKLTHETEETK